MLQLTPQPPVREQRRTQAWRPAPLAYAGATLLGLFLVARIFPPAALDGTFTLLHPTSGDTAQHIAGQRYFLADQWRWPPLLTRLIEGPEGVNIGLTDSIPLMALLAKPLRALLPPGGHVVYLWIAICYVLQPVAAVFALRSAGELRLVPALAVAVFAVCMPAFIFRFNHAALCGHFLLLLAIGLYFRIAARPRPRMWLTAAALMLASLLVHPYLAAMVVGVLGAVPLSFAARGQWRLAGLALLRLAAGIGLLGLCMAVAGYLGAERADGFGYYSLNLLSPVWFAGSSLVGGFAFLDATGGQYEGYSYLGLGLLGLTFLALAQLGRAASWRSLRDHAGLLLVALGALLFAVSDKVYFGSHLIAHLPAVPATFQQFRASGRFVWVALYLLVIAATALVSRSLPPRWVVVVLAVLAVAQYADTRGLRGQVAAVLAAPTGWSVDTAVYRPLLARQQSLTLWPTAACQPEMVASPVFMNLLLLASERALPVNSIPVARASSSTDCANPDAIRPELRPGEVRLLLPGTSPNLVAGLPGLRGLCHRLPDGVIACADDPVLVTLPPLTPAAFPVGQPVSLFQSDGAALRGLGWTASGVEGTWTFGPSATLIGAIAATPAPLRLSMTAHGLARAGQPQIVTVQANGRPVARWAVTQGADATYQAELPAGIAAAGNLVISLAIADPVRPSDVMGSSDTRALGFFLTSFRLDAPNLGSQ